jgi:DNA-binding PadR family transcriptional regulator
MMRSLNRVGSQPMSLPLSADDIVEFHVARLLLLTLVCGVKGRIDGLTKMAKLDFFARYPDFFEAARAAVTMQDHQSVIDQDYREKEIESAMVRHHYGPWDKRYYHVLAHMEAKGLITVSKERKSYRITLTDLGRERAEALARKPSFGLLVQRMGDVKRTFGGKTGTFLKTLIYRLFDEEVECTLFRPDTGASRRA